MPALPALAANCLAERRVFVNALLDAAATAGLGAQTPQRRVHFQNPRGAPARVARRFTFPAGEHGGRDLAAQFVCDGHKGGLTPLPTFVRPVRRRTSYGTRVNTVLPQCYRPPFLLPHVSGGELLQADVAELDLHRRADEGQVPQHPPE